MMLFDPIITRVRNVSGAPRFCGYLPPHGKLLADNEAVDIPGELYSVLASGLNRYTRKRELAGLVADVYAGNITLEANMSSSSSS